MDSALYVLFNKTENTYVKANTLVFAVEDGKPSVILDGKILKQYDFEFDKLSSVDFDMKLATIFEEEYDVYVLYAALMGNCDCEDTSCGPECKCDSIPN